MNVIHIDLSCRTSSYRTLDLDIIRQFTGGRGIAAHLLYENIKPGTDALDPLAPFIISTGPLTGTPFPMAGRFMAVAKSPLTNTIFSSSCGGRFGLYLRKSGIDHLVLSGKSEEPAYLELCNGEVKFHSAAALWGRDKAFVKGYLRKKHGADVSILHIGKAGENQVLFANVENDGRFLGRGGLGAVLGSKNIKAIVIAPGRAKPTIADKDTFSFLAYECKKWLSANPVTSQALPQFGTAVLYNLMRETGLLSSRNYQETAPFEASALSGEMVRSALLLRKRACPFCPVACGRVTKYGEGPEFESLWALGANLAVFNLDSVAELNSLCNDLGMDTISAGGVIAQACELTEKGVHDFGVSFGNFQKVKDLLLHIGNGSGPGALLGKGTKGVLQYYGFAEGGAHVKGLDLPAYDPRGAYGNALGYATSNRGGCHLPGYLIGTEVLGIPKLLDRFTVEGKASLLALNQNAYAFMDTMVLCRFAAFAVPTDYLARIVTAVTGTKITWEESLRIGERIWNLERLFNLREGVEADTLPERLTTFPLHDMLNEYYEVRGWDRSGVPGEEKLKQLNLRHEK
jgi:aldehyde:ferredoxin oxidoreductase